MKYLIIFLNDRPLYELIPNTKTSDWQDKFKKLESVVKFMHKGYQEMDYGVYGLLGRTMISLFKLGNKDLNIPFTFKGKSYSIQQFSFTWYIFNMVTIPLAVILSYVMIINLILIF